VATIAGAASATATVTPAPTDWWLRDPLDPTRNVRVFPADDLVLTSDEPQEVVRLLGRETAVVVADDTVWSQSGVLTLSALQGGLALLDRIRRGRRPLLLVSPYGHHLYVRLGKEVTSQVLMGRRRTMDTASYAFVVVDAP
jgi:hypothetical protein